MTDFLIDDLPNITSPIADALTESDLSEAQDDGIPDAGEWTPDDDGAGAWQQTFIDAYDNGAVGEDEIDVNAYLLLKSRGRI